MPDPRLHLTIPDDMTGREQLDIARTMLELLHEADPDVDWQVTDWVHSDDEEAAT